MSDATSRDTEGAAAAADSDLVKHVKEMLACDPGHSVKAEGIPESPRILRVRCPYCGLDVVAKRYGTDAGISPEEQRLRSEIECGHLEFMASRGFDHGAFRVPKLLGRIGSPHFAVLEECVQLEDLQSLVRRTLPERNHECLYNALSHLARYLATLHGIRESAGVRSVPSLHDTVPHLEQMGQQEGFRDVALALRSHLDEWVSKHFSSMEAGTSVVHGDLAPQHVLFKPDGESMFLIDLEAMRVDYSLSDVGTVTAELKLLFTWYTGDGRLAEPLISFFLREYYYHQRQLGIDFGSFTLLQSYFMGRRFIDMTRIPSTDAGQRKWYLETALDIWKSSAPRTVPIPRLPPTVKGVLFDLYDTLLMVKDDEWNVKNFEAVLGFLLENVPELEAENVIPAQGLRKLYYGRIDELYLSSRETFPDVNLEIVWVWICANVFKIPLDSLYQDGKRMIREILALFRETSLEYLDPAPGAVDILLRLRGRGLAVGVVSDAQTEYAQREMKRTGIFPFLDCIVLSSEFGYRKPDARLFRWGLKQMHLNQDEVVFVGDDMYRDMYGAHQAGLFTIYKQSPHGATQHEDFTPRAVIRELAELPRVIGLQS